LDKNIKMNGQPSVETATQSLSLAELPLGRPARIVRVDARDGGANETAESLERRLLEIGFQEGEPIEVAHTGLLGRDPLAVRIRDTLIAIRRHAAAQVMVEPLKD
jgi:ferrous iron transport protein A